MMAGTPLFTDDPATDIGPDVGIVFAGRRIWFEATTPTRGDAADQVPGAKVHSSWRRAGYAGCPE